MAIKLPMDANGRVIPLDTTMMYRNDNSQFHVTDFFYEARPDKWFARSGSECIEPLLGGKVCAMMADIVARARELGEAGKEDE